MRDPRPVCWLLVLQALALLALLGWWCSLTPAARLRQPRCRDGGANRCPRSRQRGSWPRSRGCIPTGCNASRAWWAWVWWPGSWGSAKASRAGEPMSWAASYSAGGPPGVVGLALMPGMLGGVSPHALAAARVGGGQWAGAACGAGHVWTDGGTALRPLRSNDATTGAGQDGGGGRAQWPAADRGACRSV